MLRSSQAAPQSIPAPPLFSDTSDPVLMLPPAWCLLFQGRPHKCALFFVDNSGVDIILGVMPFVRELLFRGTEVRLEQPGVFSPGSGLSPRLRPLLSGGAGQQLGAGSERRDQR